jgi:plasmid stabilization system protein ParE
MKHARLTTPALQDLVEIMEYIAHDNPAAAEHFGERRR